MSLPAAVLRLILLCCVPGALLLEMMCMHGKWSSGQPSLQALREVEMHVWDAPPCFSVCTALPHWCLHCPATPVSALPCQDSHSPGAVRAAVWCDM